MTTCTPVTACRSCCGAFGPTLCDLGLHPVSNAYLPPDADPALEQRFPLRAVVCGTCKMVQLDHVVDASAIFHANYAYFSSMSASWLDHAARFAAEMTARLSLTPASRVIEVASNDGYLLRNFVTAGIPCLGIEPSGGVAEAARAAGVPTLTAFLTEATGRDVARDGPADLVVANNVLAHVPDVNDFTAGLAALLAPDGVLSVEAPHLLALLDGIQFDTIYHEHYAYCSLMAVEHLFARHGLHVFDIARLPTHGGSIRYLASRTARPPSEALVTLRAEEAARGLGDDAIYAGFAPKVAEVLDGFRAWLAAMQDMGRSVAAYGAAAKGNTFLNAAGLPPGTFIAVADKATAKQGQRLPGTHVPIVSPEALRAMAPDEILILPWNIRAEVVRQWREAGFNGGLWTAVPRMERH
jgi:2-polyprenyl-3-methyl-5-hydroxy-6-metoxy-1,4-benzoquinol methylase